MFSSEPIPRKRKRLALALVPLLFLANGASPEIADVPVKKLDEAGLESSILRGVEFLLQDQNKNGSWGSARNTKGLNIYAPVPGAHHAFRCGVTAMCVLALIESKTDSTNSKVSEAIEKGEAWLLENLPRLRRSEGTALYNVWGHAYGIQALAAMHRRADGDPARKKRIEEVGREQIELLRRYESVDGGWGYYDFKAQAKQPSSYSTSFVTAAVLVAFHEATKIGLVIPEDRIRRAVASIHLQQKPDFSYAYSLDHRMSPMRGINRPAGSLGRSQACNVALRYWGDTNITESVLVEWLDRLVVRNGWLDIGRKRPIPHEAWFQVAGYFFYFGHYYAALCIGELNETLAPKYRQELAGLIVPLQEKDGSWWDFPFYDYHQPYGTAFALMTLARCQSPSKHDSVPAR